MFVQYQKNTKKIPKSLVQHKSPQVYIKEESTILRVSPDICLDWYKPTISNTVELVWKLNDKHHVEALFVVGGLANSHINCTTIRYTLRPRLCHCQRSSVIWSTQSHCKQDQLCHVQYGLFASI